MQPLQLLLAIMCAAGSSAKPGPTQIPETRPSARLLALPPPSAVNGVKPFQFPTDHNGTANDFDGIPEMWLYCSKTSEWITPSYVDELVNGSLLQSSMDHGMIPYTTGWVWNYPLDKQSSQIYICNHNQLFSFSISAGMFHKVNIWLDNVCGKTMAGYVYLGIPWDVAIGRNSTDAHGYPQPECGGKWSPDQSLLG